LVTEFLRHGYIVGVQLMLLDWRSDCLDTST